MQHPSVLARSVLRFGWLLLLSLPLVQLLTTEHDAWQVAVAWAGTGLFVALYLPMFRKPPGEPGGRSDLALVAGLGVVAFGLTASLGPAWSLTFVFSTVAAAVRVPAPWGARAVVVSPALVVGASLLSGVDDPGSTFGYAISAPGVGLLMLIIGQLRRANAELAEARAALAERAVAEERVRFARDLHDLLGHSLSVIALKSELARRLLERDPDAAAQHVGEVEQIARDALVEVREAVSGYRRPTLAGELAGARLALEAAGVRAELEDRTSALLPEAEAVLAWAVREGVTNVVRHAGARTCSVVVTDAGVEVRDDGCGTEAAGGVAAGNGLVGLRERVEALRGSLESGRSAEGGFRLSVRLGGAA